MRILLVEDEPSAAKMLAKGLREQSYAVCGLFAKRIGKIRARADEMVVCGMGT